MSDWQPYTTEKKYVHVFKTAITQKFQSNYDEKRMKVWFELDQKADKDPKRKSEDQLNLDQLFQNIFKVYFAKGFNI